ncbi:hypothetical protein K466DRAFT_605727 [Polyporus arcularius HHB13444]|uniref:Phenol hydroxylase-like C-terminal dimerisation domain-containing protein n=1 Tax=Polyporus arcularius HHB13444 TaxID=1314778 RepID=A0A5C3NVC8_9APHY|nr:hypothetical protein K466DRAFT_605727 [Polyporus arcularius HHB13444]
MARAHALATKLDAPKSFLHRYGQCDYHKVFDILYICAGSKDEVDFIDVPEMFRPHLVQVSDVALL